MSESFETNESTPVLPPPLLRENAPTPSCMLLFAEKYKSLLKRKKNAFAYIHKMTTRNDDDGLP